MKKTLLLSALIGLLMTACQSTDVEPQMHDDALKTSPAQEENVQQITEDVNSGEVKNILGNLFGKQRKGRSTDYTVSLLKDKDGVDRIICINYSDDGGFALISAEKTYEPILAYSDKGNFDISGELPFPLNEWMDCTMHSIADSESLPADSLQKIANIWRKYDDLDYSKISKSIKSPQRLPSIDWDTYYGLTRQMMDKMAEWKSNGYRVYSLDEYDGMTSIGDKDAIASYVQSRILPTYAEEYRSLALIVEKDISSTYGRGHWIYTEWDQALDYNQSFEFVPGSTTEHIPVGCGPLAIGQIMYSYRYPNTFNWDAMTLTGFGNKTTSDFLLDVKEKCNAEYNPETGGTGCNQFQQMQALNHYGYTFQYTVPKNITEYNLVNYPAIISSHESWKTVTGKELDGDHAWIIEGGKCTHSRTDIEIWSFPYENFECIHNESTEPDETFIFYVNWGRSRGYQAYYSLASMIEDGHISNSINSGLLGIKPNNQ